MCFKQHNLHIYGFFLTGSNTYHFILHQPIIKATDQGTDETDEMYENTGKLELYLKIDVKDGTNK